MSFLQISFMHTYTPVLFRTDAMCRSVRLPQTLDMHAYILSSSVCLSPCCPSVDFCIRQSVYMSVSWSDTLNFCLPVCMAAWLHVLLPSCLPIPVSLCPPFCLSAPSSLCLSACLCRGEDRKVRKKKLKKQAGADVEVLTALPAVPGAAGLEGLSR